MSSSRYIAAARQRRAEPPSKPVTQQRQPVTSIASQAAFQQQHQNNQTQRMQQMQQMQQAPRGIPPQHMNRANIMNQMNQNNRMQQQMPQQMPQQMQQQMPQQMQTETTDNAIPMPSRLTISDAIGLITLRLGKVEQYIIDHQNDNVSQSTMSNSVPENSEIVDKSVLHNIVNRLDSIEKKEPKIDNSVQISKLENEVNSIKQLLQGFMTDMEKRMTDFEYAFSEMEKNFMVPTETFENYEIEDTEHFNVGVDVDNVDIDIQMEEVEENMQHDKTETIDLKNIVEMELKSKSTQHNVDLPIGY